MIYVKVLARTLEMIRDGNDRRAKMWENSNKIRSGLKNLGFTIGDVPSPLCPVYVPAGDIQLGTAIIKAVRDQGVFITGVAYPVIPRGLLLFRMVPTSSHTDEDIERTIAVFKDVRDKLNLTNLAAATHVLADEKPE
jgi:glycine C-acetyltransferase